MPNEDLLDLFAALGRVAEDTRRLLLQALLHEDRRLTPEEQERLQSTLGHLGNVREGFIVTVRASAARSPSELRDLVQHVLVDWSWLEQLGLSWEAGPSRVELPVAQVLSFAHASVALGTLPHIPPEVISFPQPRASYADIPVPHSPGEWLERIEELETTIAQVGERPAATLARDRLRRTFGYFDASAWLVAHEQSRWRSAPPPPS